MNISISPQQARWQRYLTSESNKMELADMRTQDRHFTLTFHPANNKWTVQLNDKMLTNTELERTLTTWTGPMIDDNGHCDIERFEARELKHITDVTRHYLMNSTVEVNVDRT